MFMKRREFYHNFFVVDSLKPSKMAQKNRKHLLNPFFCAEFKSVETCALEQQGVCVKCWCPKLGVPLIPLH